MAKLDNPALAVDDCYGSRTGVEGLMTTSTAAVRKPGRTEAVSHSSVAYLMATNVLLILRVSRRRREMYTGHARVYVCVSVRGRIHTLLRGPGCDLGDW